MSSFFKRSVLGCGSIKNIVEPATLEKLLIHIFYPDESKPNLSNLTKEQQKCVKEYTKRFKITPISKIKENREKSAILKKLIRVGQKKIKKHMTPEVESSSIARASSAETGFASEIPSETLAEIPSNPRSKITNFMTHKPYSSTTKIRKENSPETGFASVPKREPTVDEFLEDPFVYPEWIESINKSGGATRRKKSRARKTRRYL
jgi:hypothetical protein